MDSDLEMAVFDNAVPPDLVARVWEYSQQYAAWEFKNRGVETDALTSWVADLVNAYQDLDIASKNLRWRELGVQMPFLHEIWELMVGRVDRTLQIQRIFLNGHTFGLGDSIHDDGGPGSYTFLLYVNPVWRPEWGGETMFYNVSVDDVVAAVLPKPGRVIFFDGRLPHAGRAPARGFTGLRVTLAFQTVLVPHDA